MHPTQTLLQAVATHHTFLYAHTVNLLNTIGFCVYRSVALPKTDDWYKPVARFLNTNNPVHLFTKVVEDPGMWFGEAEMSMYEMKESYERSQVGFADQPVHQVPVLVLPSAYQKGLAAARCMAWAGLGCARGGRSIREG